MLHAAAEFGEGGGGEVGVVGDEGLRGLARLLQEDAVVQQVADLIIHQAALPRAQVFARPALLQVGIGDGEAVLGVEHDAQAAARRGVFHLSAVGLKRGWVASRQ